MTWTKTILAGLVGLALNTYLDASLPGLLAFILVLFLLVAFPVRFPR